MPNRPRQKRDTNTYDKANRKQPEPAGTELLRRRGVANGYAPLDGSSLVPVANLPPLILENRTSDPGSPAVGQLWLRTDL